MKPDGTREGTRAEPAGGLLVAWTSFNAFLIRYKSAVIGKFACSVDHFRMLIGSSDLT